MAYYLRLCGRKCCMEVSEGEPNCFGERNITVSYLVNETYSAGNAYIFLWQIFHHIRQRQSSLKMKVFCSALKQSFLGSEEKNMKNVT